MPIKNTTNLLLVIKLLQKTNDLLAEEEVGGGEQRTGFEATVAQLWKSKSRSKVTSKEV